MAAPTRPPWLAALCGAVAVHLALASFALLHHEGAPAPGAGAQAFEVVLAPAWPEPGRRSTQLGSTTKPTLKSGPAKTPSTAPISAALAPDPTSAPIDPVRPRPAETSAATTTVAAATPPAAAARTDEPPSAPSAAEALWDGSVLAKLASLKRYPTVARRAGQQDTIFVRFVVDRMGQVLSAEIAQSRGFLALDTEARALVARASPLPPPPAEVVGEEIELIVPIQFTLHRAP